MFESVISGRLCCGQCKGSGVMTVRGGPFSAIMNEAGEFCRDCSMGKRRWETTLRLIRECEVCLTPTRSSGAPVPRNTRVFLKR
jgi:hypothetical protein